MGRVSLSLCTFWFAEKEGERGVFFFFGGEKWLLLHSRRRWRSIIGHGRGFCFSSFFPKINDSNYIPPLLLLLCLSFVWGLF